jgi:predicted AlkP superfamily phosphohydrolase/phosphomutase
MNFLFGKTIVLALLLLLCWPNPAWAYIGPGSGFVFASSFLAILAAFLLAFFYILTWPFRLLLRPLLRRGKKIQGKPLARRVIILGLDGMDYQLTSRFLAEGKLPNFFKLAQSGAFAPLATTLPSISPVAWSSFATGVDPSYHNIFDFLTRNPRTYQPLLSSTHIGKPPRVLRLGKYRIPLGKPVLRLNRKSRSFWSLLGEYGIPSAILRVPITFPPEKFNGVLLSGMCVPDLKGSQGSFSYFTSDPSDRRGEIGGVRHSLEVRNGKADCCLYGPANDFVENGRDLELPLSITVDEKTETACLRVDGQKLSLRKGHFSPWVRLSFRPLPGVKLRGICQFYLLEVKPHLRLYVSPLHIDPEHPALPISHPVIYSVYLSKLTGLFSTLGLAEDTWAVNEGILSEEAFLEQCWSFFEEREKIFWKALARTRKGVCAFVFDTTDRIQHMFFGSLDAGIKQDSTLAGKINPVEELYQRMDSFLGRVLSALKKDDLLVIMSDHGFTRFRRGVNLNAWLHQHGYLAMKNGAKPGDWFQGVDWAGTRAYSLGLAGIFINRKGREASGIVEDGAELIQLKAELIGQLAGLMDEEKGTRAIRRVVDTTRHYQGPYRFDAPDLLVGFESGYRSSWSCATGRVTDAVFEDNDRAWDGDHAVDPLLVPGVLFMNRKISAEHPAITDLAPTVLKVFGIDPPGYMRGKILL